MLYKNQDKILEEVVCQLRDGTSLPLLTFSGLSKIPGIRHCFTTRAGGVSSGIYESLNLSFTRGDDETAVRQNYDRVAEAMGTDSCHIVTSDQTHTTNIRRVTAQDAGKGVVHPRDYHDIDGLMTDEPGLLLATFFADCVPLYFVDPVHRAIGLAHSGWKGTVNFMGQAMVEAMGEAFDTNPKDLICAVGPSICQDCYEVSADVADAFAEKFAEQADQILLPKDNEKYQLDLWQANRLILLAAGVPKDQIYVTNLCTCCNPAELFSHRASHGKRGNLGAFLMLESEGKH